MKCTRCSSDRIFEMKSKSRDCNYWQFKEFGGDSYAPNLPGICGGDYVGIKACLECGQLQGQFPLDSKELERHRLQDIIDAFWDSYSVPSGADVFLAEDVATGVEVIYFRIQGSYVAVFVAVFFGDNYPACGEKRVLDELPSEISDAHTTKLKRP